MQPDYNIVNRVISDAYDARDYEAMRWNSALANADGVTIAQHIRMSIECTLEGVHYEDGSVCPPEDRGGWMHLVY